MTDDELLAHHAKCLLMAISRIYMFTHGTFFILSYMTLISLSDNEWLVVMDVIGCFELCNNCVDVQRHHST